MSSCIQPVLARRQRWRSAGTRTRRLILELLGHDNASVSTTGHGGGRTGGKKRQHLSSRKHYLDRVITVSSQQHANALVQVHLWSSFNQVDGRSMRRAHPLCCSSVCVPAPGRMAGKAPPVVLDTVDAVDANVRTSSRFALRPASCRCVEEKLWIINPCLLTKASCGPLLVRESLLLPLQVQVMTVVRGHSPEAMKLNASGMPGNISSTSVRIWRG